MREHAGAATEAAAHVAARIRQARGADTIAGVLPLAGASVVDVAACFGLSSDAACYHEIDTDEAAAVLEALLHRDLAYGVELMPATTARQLAADFIALFAGTPVRWFTNGSWGRPPVAPGVGPEWSPATDATFDAGVIALATTAAGCVWCMDED